MISEVFAILISVHLGKMPKKTPKHVCNGVRSQMAKADCAAVYAEYRRGQALGSIYIDKKITLTGSIDSMSKEQVKKRLEDMRAMYGKAIPEVPERDVTPASTQVVDGEIVEPEALEEVVEAIAEQEKPKPLLEGMRKQEKVRERTGPVTNAKFSDAPPRD